MRLLIAVITAAVLLIVTSFLIDYSTYEQLNPLHAIESDKCKNGLWLRYYWYVGKYSNQDWKLMLERLQKYRIKYAYFHVLTAKADGSLRYHHLDNARKITNAVHTTAPGTQAIAWVYVGQYDAGVDLSRPQVRRTLVKEALWLVEKCGFDGIQWDYEFCFSGDQGLLSLLRETRAALPQRALLSVDTPMWYPGTLWGWNDTYFKQVARCSDQLVVMCYDSYVILPRLYVWLVAQQVIHITSDVELANPKCHVVLGLPTYEDVTAAHHKHAENLSNALRGVALGLSNLKSRSEVLDGIALFADYTTDNSEWKTYSDYWRLPLKKLK